MLSDGRSLRSSSPDLISFAQASREVSGVCPFLAALR
ncbi:MAG: hypothetical protein AVDCRST_MAG83-13 [uncultured Arthrobacter sp.]|uniref:Uncharacterized protein n=1 Tax=uncultured Arthrobacter sp. TaxID=114050 RepID=A0A6J4H4U7_9MICC|nr:MAG: hypothetical protein AVDCRST_MAG83-13 [uncultured Arthrobacter sp.]